jgi:hypothetical protein
MTHRISLLQTWGEQNTETEAHAQLGLAAELGVNALDTAVRLFAAAEVMCNKGQRHTVISCCWQACHDSLLYSAYRVS